MKTSKFWLPMNFNDELNFNGKEILHDVYVDQGNNFIRLNTHLHGSQFLCNKLHCKDEEYNLYSQSNYGYLNHKARNRIVEESKKTSNRYDVDVKITSVSHHYNQGININDHYSTWNNIIRNEYGPRLKIYIENIKVITL